MTPRPENPSLRPSSAPEKQLITVLLNTIKYLAGLHPRAPSGSSTSAKGRDARLDLVAFLPPRIRYASSTQVFRPRDLTCVPSDPKISGIPSNRIQASATRYLISAPDASSARCHNFFTGMSRLQWSAWTAWPRPRFCGAGDKAGLPASTRAEEGPSKCVSNCACASSGSSRSNTPCTMPKARSRAISEPSQSTSAAAAPGFRFPAAEAIACKVSDSVCVP